MEIVPTMARKWSENGKQFTRNKRLFRDAQEIIQRLFLAELPPAALAITIVFFITIANDLYKMLTGFLQALITLFMID